MNEETNSLPEELFEISNLIEKYINQEISGNEKIVLDAWIQESDENKKLFEELTDNKNIRKRTKQFHEVSERTGIVKQRAREAVFGEKVKVKQIQRNWKTLVAAAAIIFAIATGSYLWISNKNNKPVASTETAKMQNDKGPGKDGAILKLANGQEIVLDSAGNGNVAEQGSTKIIKNGALLTYNNEKGNSEKVLYNTLSTPRGRQFQVVLPDGSKVWLNSASSIVFPTFFSGDTRKVEISGEAYFEVVHDKLKPFIVAVNGTVVQVLGTHFNINAYSDEATIKTTLLEGAVKVVKNGNAVEIKPGQQTQVTGNEVKVISDVDIDAAVAWKNGLIVFNGADIKAILRQISRWYDVDVEYKGEISVPEIYGKIPRTVNLSDALKALEINSKLHFTIEGNTIIVQQ